MAGTCFALAAVTGCQVGPMGKERRTGDWPIIILGRSARTFTEAWATSMLLPRHSKHCSCKEKCRFFHILTFTDSAFWEVLSLPSSLYSSKRFKFKSPSIFYLHLSFLQTHWLMRFIYITERPRITETSQSKFLQFMPSKRFRISTLVLRPWNNQTIGNIKNRRRRMEFFNQK